MKKKLQKFNALLLALLLAASSVSCGSSESNEAEDNNPTTVQSDMGAESESESETEPEPDLPDVTFGGREINIMSRSATTVQYFNNEISAQEITGEVLNDTIYERNQAVETQFDIVITNQPENNPASVISESILAGVKTSSILVDSYKNLSTLINSQYLQGLQDVPYVDLSKPWWNSDAMESVALFGEQYIGMSDILLNDKQRTYITIMNKGLLNQYNLEAPYDLAREGKWTLDRMRTMAETVVKDLDGNGTMDANDQFGLCTEQYCSYVFFAGSGGRLTEMDDTGKPAPALYSERNVDVLDTIIRMLTDASMTGLAEQVANPNGGGEYWTLGIDLMSENRSLFVMGVVSWIQQIIQSSEADPGVLPVPKYEESQQEYHTIGQPAHCNGIAVPTSVIGEELELAGIVMEALSAYSYDTVMPAYIDATVKGRYSVDKESAEMLDIVFDSMTFDLGMVYNWGGILNLLTADMYVNNENVIASAYASKESAILAAVDEAVENYQNSGE